MILTCKQCKESYDTAWGYHNDDYCTSSCHILQLEAEVARLRNMWSELKDEVVLQMKGNENAGGEFNEAANIVFEQFLEEMTYLEQASEAKK